MPKQQQQKLQQDAAVTFAYIQYKNSYKRLKMTWVLTPVFYSRTLIKKG